MQAEVLCFFLFFYPFSKFITTLLLWKRVSPTLFGQEKIMYLCSSMRRKICSSFCISFLLSICFTVTVYAAASIQTDKNNYQPGESVQVSFSGALGSSRDWVCISPVSSPDTTAGDYQYFPSGVEKGSLTFTAPAAGRYEVRAYYDYSRLGYVVSARYAFSVGGVTGSGGPSQSAKTAAAVNGAGAEDPGLGIGYFMSELSGSAKPTGGLAESVPVKKKYKASKSKLWNGVQDVLDEQGYFFSADSSSGRIKTDPKILGNQNQVTMFGATYAAVVSIKVRDGNVSFRARFNKQSNVVMGGSLLEYPEKENALRKQFFADLDAMLQI